MAMTDAEVARINTLESAINDMWTAVNNLMTKEQMRQLILIKQNELDAALARIDSLETQVETLQNKIA
tara:strand:- start:296 stop:499 length:204 start_codon:yes stop_codon:yes gene_type:complete